MSGGSLDYVHSKVRDAIEDLLRYRHLNPPLMRAFIEHLKLVADALHDVEWQTSGDGADWEASVRAVLAPGAEIESAVALAKEAQADLARALAEASGEKPRP